MDNLDAWELLHWMAYDRLDPIGADRLDYLAGVIASGQANVWRGKDETPVQPLDTIPDWGGLRAELKLRQAEQQQQASGDPKDAWRDYADAVARLEGGG